MNRTPPVEVRRRLSAEVGFGCPVDGCGSPYLHWHHFDPPWSVREHHDPDGMVALCRDHHPDADAGAFTLEQLREFKVHGRDRRHALGARFNWMRDELIAIVGGNIYYQVDLAVQFREFPVVWFTRDSEGHVLVNVHMLTRSREPRMVMFENVWITEGSTERTIICPPSGRLVEASYPNGDELRIEFRELASVDDLDRIQPAWTRQGEAPRSHAVPHNKPALHSRSPPEKSQ